MEPERPSITKAVLAIKTKLDASHFQISNYIAKLY